MSNRKSISSATAILHHRWSCISCHKTYLVDWHRPAEAMMVDIGCITTWMKACMVWQGFLFELKTLIGSCWEHPCAMVGVLHTNNSLFVIVLYIGPSITIYLPWYGLHAWFGLIAEVKTLLLTQDHRYNNGALLWSQPGIKSSKQ